MTMYVQRDTLRKDVRYLMDRTQILDCISRHARGCDRHDIDLISSAYHSDGVDEHGHAINAGPDYGEWVNKTHAETSRVHTHNITTHTCDINGDTAHAESYVIVVLIGPDTKSAQFITGRYIDRLERREGRGASSFADRQSKVCSSPTPGYCSPRSSLRRATSLVHGIATICPTNAR